jgi:hypothetical protein
LARESQQTIDAVLGIPADVEARLPRALWCAPHQIFGERNRLPEDPRRRGAEGDVWMAQLYRGARQGLDGLALIDIAPGGSGSRTQSQWNIVQEELDKRSWSASDLGGRIWGEVGRVEV